MKVSRKFKAENIIKADGNTLEQEISRQVIEQGTLESLILEYEYGKGKLQHVHVIAGSFALSNETSGVFKAGYELNEFSMCAAIDYTATETMTIRFESDKTSGEVTLTGEQRNERFDEL